MSEMHRELTDLIGGLAPELHGRAPRDQWARLSALGLTGIALAEADGGSGGELADLLHVIAELSRHGVVTPIVEGSTAVLATGRLVDDEFGTVALVDGDVLTEPSSRITASAVPYAEEAALLVVGDDVASASFDASLLTIREGDEANPAGQSLHHVSVDGAAATRLETSGAALRTRLRLARAAALLGSARGAYDLTKRYVVQREQFGAPLIKIPAVAAALADMAIQTRFGESALRRALAIVGAPTSPLLQTTAAASARITAAGVATRVARTAHQLHGAVGVTLEYDLHRYSEALWSWRDADEHEDVVSERLGALARTNDEAAWWDEMTAVAGPVEIDIV